ncbi:cytochrome P450 [Rhodobacterales bacterium HKCCE2091]|nr:cytochrome P450 [Rhodobacterales bacterium HKCCE2091]
MKPEDTRPQPRNTHRFSRDHDFTATVDGFDEIHELFHDLRRRCPVAHSNDMGGFWLYTRYEDVAHAISTPKVYTTRVQNIVPKVASTGRRPPLHLDPPEHTPYRRALAPLFRKELLDEWQVKIRDIAARLFQPFIDDKGGDMCRGYSYGLPAEVLAEFFGLSDQDARKVRDQGQEFTIAIEEMDLEKIQATSLVLYEAAGRLILDRKETPRDPRRDPVSAMLAARHNDAPLPDDLILGTVRQLLLVGIIAPTTFIGSITIHFSRHPEHLALLRDDPAKIPAAVEELLRLYSPYRGFARTPVEDIVVNGRHICQDEPIALSFCAANRDPSVFRDPDTFRLDRSDEPDHIAFGRGPHMCMGRDIAMIMITATVELMARHVKEIEIVGPVPMTTWPEYGPLSVPVRLALVD